MNLAAAQKSHLRTSIKHQRSTLTNPFMERSAIALLGHVSHAQLIENNTNLAFYIPTKGEISCWPLIEYAMSLNKNCYIPKVFPNNKRGMWFLPYEGKESVQTGPLNIQEPTGPTHKAIRPSALDVVFLPLVAFDDTGNRLGMGGGYYDSVFSDLQKDEDSAPKMIGLGYNFQQVNELPKEAWDLTLDGIITPSYFRLFNQND